MTDTPTLNGHLAHLAEYAGNFITHWMEDDGNDAEDKARCDEAETRTTNAENALSAAILCAHGMSGTLESAAELLEELAWIVDDDCARTIDAMRQAISATLEQAKAKGLTL